MHVCKATAITALFSIGSALLDTFRFAIAITRVNGTICAATRHGTLLIGVCAVATMHWQGAVSQVVPPAKSLVLLSKPRRHKLDRHAPLR